MLPLGAMEEWTPVTEQQSPDGLLPAHETHRLRAQTSLTAIRGRSLGTTRRGTGLTGPP